MKNSGSISPKIKLTTSRKHGKGLFAKEEMRKGEKIIDLLKSIGRFLTNEEADKIYDKFGDYMLQIDDDLFYAATNESELENCYFINHSCNPNCGIDGELRLVAIRDIKVGEEITFDYAMSESSDYSFKCNCGNANCRKIITGNDWKIEKLQKQYKGYFSNYLHKKICQTN